MADFTNLPTEIWVLIARFIPTTLLSHLKSLNSFFLNCWMDRSWKVLLIRREDHKYERILQRVADPFVSTRTKNLTIEFYRSITSYSTISVPTLFRTVMAVPFSRTLQEQFLRGNVDYFAELGECLARTTPFETLTKFSLTLDALNEHITESSLPLIPLFRFLPSTLHHLKILNLSITLDLSSLFNSLSESACYPKLIFLELEFIFNPSFRYSCQSIHRFLLTHNNNLQFLDLNIGLKDAPRDEEHLGVWLNNLASTEFQFSSLQTLGISFSTPQTGLSAVLPLIKRTAPTLSTLSFGFHPLAIEEAERVVDALTEGGGQFSMATRTTVVPGKLKSLSIVINQLSVPFLDLLARNLPQLQELYLWTPEIIGSDQQSFYDLLYHRRYDPSIPSSTTQDHLHTWKLHDFCVFVALMRSTTAMRAVAGAVPSVVIQDEVDGLLHYPFLYSRSKSGTYMYSY